MTLIALINTVTFVLFVGIALWTNEGEVHRLKYWLMMTVFASMLAMDIHSL